MSQVTAQLNDYRHSPRKVRVVANLVKGRHAEDAIAELQFLGKRAADPISKLIRSAMASAKNSNLDERAMVVKEMRVDGGAIMYRRRSASRGRAPIIRKRTSHILLVLQEEKSQAPKSKSQKDSKPKKPTPKS
ncbi:MAG: 50S ribosomal protein L22 [Candidatus Zambryskibacteria bacterium RIFCSPHIGHO2_01_FULL_43_27]|uniref:Large ribosomal subunit protein uL22 n=1 Tax=Candidatus Zambryskibacteria bacterium RIFCSPLOWO2_01_FULL_43_17 TaxID=1802760 RepID=A0A1G2U5V5_9BACT|nr:MAG: 50S ribosomal protein L22 [Candidatus Zambryskibacteria bacterium RIFCSPHIGHO2_01_FULL_43_27]OHB00020.1 MAG: 50S ribosomal protein L22 [Candidatus Zambryskibacteria bacterium RIFCSPHIGHO2_12_FULL_43_12b]OHB04252.1 MAG: 50S ribosomal protein L22 [Candidatus Zambryskibacteria bacterium RIFCSPLOWO2_01_FULL_43_17]